MPRTADYTIKGFLYQFNKALHEILIAADDSKITVEGIVEDVEVVTPLTTKAVQCKYHEASKKFTPSYIFKPLLQMMSHFHSNSGSNIEYILFAHFPITPGTPLPAIGKTELQAALDSDDKSLQKYSSPIRGKVDLDAFLARFNMQFGPTYDELVDQVHAALEANGVPKADVDTLAYPNAINMVANLSVRHDLLERQTTKLKFVEELKSIRKTAISRWTLALHTRKQLLAARRKQLKNHLDKNSRLRYFVVDPNKLDDFKQEIVLFISDYLDRYHFKLAHICTPVFCLNTSKVDLADIQLRLYQKAIRSADGYIGPHFDQTNLFREPLSQKVAGGGFTREFLIRILRWEDHGELLNERKCDDLFIIGEARCESLNTVDVNVERLAVRTLKEAKYLMGVSDVYE